MTGLMIVVLVLLYIFIGLILTRWVVQRGTMTVTNDKYYGAVALLWPVAILGFVYLLFNAIVYAITEV